MPRKYQRKTKRPYNQQKPQNLPAKYEPGYFGKLDGRTTLAKAMAANYDQIVADLGGMDSLSYFQRSLIERALWMEGVIQKYEHELATADKETAETILGKWTQMVNAYAGLCRQLGLEKQSSNKPWADPIETEATEATEEAA